MKALLMISGLRLGAVGVYVLDTDIDTPRETATTRVYNATPEAMASRCHKKLAVLCLPTRCLSDTGAVDLRLCNCYLLIYKMIYTDEQVNPSSLGSLSVPC